MRDDKAVVGESVVFKDCTLEPLSSRSQPHSAFLIKAICAADGEIYEGKAFNDTDRII